MGHKSIYIAKGLDLNLLYKYDLVLLSVMIHEVDLTGISQRFSSDIGSDKLTTFFCCLILTVL